MKLEVKIENFDIPAPGGTCDFLISQPTENGRHPAVLFLMDAFGLRPYLSEMAETLASKGYIVFQPNILYRSKRSPMISLPFPLRPDDMPAARNEIIPLARGYDPELGLA